MGILHLRGLGHGRGFPVLLILVLVLVLVMWVSFRANYRDLGVFRWFGADCHLRHCRAPKDLHGMYPNSHFPQSASSLPPKSSRPVPFRREVRRNGNRRLGQGCSALANPLLSV